MEFGYPLIVNAAGLQPDSWVGGFRKAYRGTGSSGLGTCTENFCLDREMGCMRRICCLVEHWKSGGIESFLYNVLTRIDLSRLRVDVVAASLGESIFTSPLRERGIRFFELSGSQRKVAENHRRFCLLLRERRWEVLYLNAFQGLSLYYLHLARRAGIPVRFAHSHNTALRRSLTQPLKLAVHCWARERYTADATDLWACSQDAAEFLFSKRELEQKGYTFIPNGIDTQRFRFDPAVRKRVRAELGLDGKLVIGNIGRLCDQKNQDFLLDVFAEVLRRRPESRLLLVGEGENKPRLERKAQELEVAEKVIFYGVSDHVERLLWAMDVFAFPSRFEGLGIAVIEAQAAGLPVVCSEYVPPEANASYFFQSISLSAGAKRWAEVLLGVLKRAPDGAQAVYDAGFDITHAVRKVEASYLRLDVL